MSSAPDSKTKMTGKKAPLTQEQIIVGFNQLRQEQRSLATHIVELEAESNEHGLVIDALKGVSSDRKCFRLVGGVLVERIVGDVLPSLETNKANITKLIENLKEQVVVKGKEIGEYMEKHNIQVRGQETSPNAPPEARQETSQTSPSTSGVLTG